MMCNSLFSPLGHFCQPQALSLSLCSFYTVKYKADSKHQHCLSTGLLYQKHVPNCNYTDPVICWKDYLALMLIYSTAPNRRGFGMALLPLWVFC